MFNIKKFIATATITACGLALAIPCSNVSTNVSAISPPIIIDMEKGLDSIDVLLASHYFLASSQNDINFWSSNPSDFEIVPLYDIRGEITSYYVELGDGFSYAVINNNVENPTAIEFGRGCNLKIRAILDNIDNPHIIYNSPVSVYNASDIMTLSYDTDIYDNYPDLCEPNPNLANIISQQKSLLDSTPMPCGDGDYGFIDGADIPSGSYNTSSISGYRNVQWISTGETASFAQNHCGSVAVTNLALYFTERGNVNLMVDNSRIETFKAVHKVVGNGPKMTIAEDAKKYFSNCRYTLKYSTYHSVYMSDRIAAENKAIRNNRPCGILLEDGIDSWHWVIAVGYRNYTSGDSYFQIVDGWSNNASKYYKPGEGSNWISMTEYWV